MPQVDGQTDMTQLIGAFSDLRESIFKKKCKKLTPSPRADITSVRYQILRYRQ